jgi:hypothetical protein
VEKPWEHGNKTSDSIIDSEFLDQLSNYQLVKLTLSMELFKELVLLNACDSGLLTL